MNVYTLGNPYHRTLFNNKGETGLLTHVTTWNLHTIIIGEKVKVLILYGSIYTIYAVKNDKIV